jgi:hypothetical protein
MRRASFIRIAELQTSCQTVAGGRANDRLDWFLRGRCGLRRTGSSDHRVWRFFQRRADHDARRHCNCYASDDVHPGRNLDTDTNRDAEFDIHEPLIGQFVLNLAGLARRATI